LPTWWGNTIEHGGGEATVRITRDGDRARIDVSDRRPGIPPEDLPHLFDRFYQADVSRSSRGSGLGLAIAWENARLLGTTIEVESEPGRGATFSVMFGKEAPESREAESFRSGSSRGQVANSSAKTRQEREQLRFD
jgi:signal transduction histidine kinase